MKAVDSEVSLENLYEEDWTRAVAAVSAEVETLWLDSACFMHVCPLNSFTQFPLEPPTQKLGALAANGQELKHYGQRRVRLEVGNSVVDAVFQVLGVSRALLRVSQMTEKGWETQFREREAQARIGVLKLPLQEDRWNVRNKMQE